MWDFCLLFQDPILRRCRSYDVAVSWFFNAKRQSSKITVLQRSSTSDCQNAKGIYVEMICLMYYILNWFILSEVLYYYSSLQNSHGKVDLSNKVFFSESGIAKNITMHNEGMYEQRHGSIHFTKCYCYCWTSNGQGFCETYTPRIDSNI